MTRSPELVSPDILRADLSGDLSVVVGGLHDEFDARLGAAVVDRDIQVVADRFTRARVRSFVPLLVRRYARERLRELSAA